MLLLIIKIACFIGLLIIVAMVVFHLLPWIIGVLAIVGVFKLLGHLARRNPTQRQLPPARWPWKE